jgi:hypothetical protein
MTVHHPHPAITRGGWFIFDDGDVMQSNEDELRRTLFTSLASRTTAYLLFYKRDDENDGSEFDEAEDCHEAVEASQGSFRNYPNGVAEISDALIVTTAAADEESGMAQDDHLAAIGDGVRHRANLGKCAILAETPGLPSADANQSTKETGEPDSDIPDVENLGSR